MNKKKSILLSILICVLVGIVTFYGVIKPKSITVVNQEEKITNNDVKIALVNEDNGIIYNGDNLQIGELLVNTLGKKTEYNVETVSRAIAENGIEKGNYNLIVFLPSNFSRETLALEDSSPKQAIFQYKIKSDQQTIVKQSEQVVSEIKNLFNKELISIYFSSIIGNLQTAQTQVGTAIGREKSVLNKYQSNLLQPLTNYATQFKGLSGNSENLISSYSSFNKSIHDTDEAFTSIMDTNKTYDKEIDKIKSLQEEWQSSIKLREENLTKYDEEFKKLSVTEQLESLKNTQKYLSDNLLDPAVLKDTEEKSDSLNKSIESTETTFTNMNSNINNILNTYKEKLSTAVAESLEKTKKNEIEKQSIGLLVDDLKNTMLSKVTESVENLPHFDINTIDKLNINSADKEYLKKVNLFAEKYSQKHGVSLKVNSQSYSQSNIDELKKIASNNIKKQQKITFSKTAGQYNKVVLSVNPEYKIVNVETSNGNISKNSDNQITINVQQPVDELTITYQLDYKKDILLITPANVEATATTVENIEVAKESEEKSEVEKEGKKVVETKKVYKPEKKEIQRTVSKNNIVLPVDSINVTDQNVSIYNDLKNYTQLTTVVKTIYGLDINKDNFDSLEPKEDSLLKKAELKDLNKILTSLVSNTILDQMKKELLIPDEKIKELQNLKLNSTELKGVIGDLRKTTQSLSTSMNETITETEKVYEALAKKPEFKDTEKRDNTDLVTVTVDINKDLTKLMSASNKLLSNTKSNQSTSEALNKGFENLGESVKKLEQDGTGLTGKVEDLKKTMDGDYGNNEEFLKSFSKVLSNTKDGNEKNQAVYDYLSNPINAGNIDKLVSTNNISKSFIKQDTRTGMIVILVVYLISIVLAHMLQNLDFSKLQNTKFVSRFHWKNSLIPISIIGISSAIASFLISVIVGTKLDFSIEKIIGLIIIIFLVTIMFLGINNILLRKGNTLGLLISISILLLYIITATQLVEEREASQALLSSISPLNYLDESLTKFMNSQGEWVTTIVIAGIVAVIGIVLNIIEYRKIKL